MALRQASIEITDDGSDCTQYYQVEIKLAADTGYTLLDNQFESPIVITNLQPGTSYNARITRFCCNGAYNTTIVDLSTGS